MIQPKLLVGTVARRCVGASLCHLVPGHAYGDGGLRGPTTQCRF